MERQQLGVIPAVPWLAGGASIQQVAADLGYESMPSFVTMFRKTLPPPQAGTWRTDIPADMLGSHRAMVQPKTPILVLLYEQAQRIYSLTPATGEIPIHQA